MKAQLFSPIYSIVFACAILTVLVLFLSTIKDWENKSILKTDAVMLESVINVIANYDKYITSFKTSTMVNITIDSSTITISSDNSSVSRPNAYNINPCALFNVDSFTISKYDNSWVIY